MDFAFSEQQRRFRDEVRALVEAQLRAMLGHFSV